jgi:membrane-associated phospholipid phosphatase
VKARMFWLLVLALNSLCYARAQINVLADPDLPAASPLQSPESSTLAPDSGSWKRIIPDIAADQKRVWTFPLHIFEHNNWMPVMGVLAATSGLVALDPVDTPPFRRSLTAFHGFNNALSGRNTILITAAVPVSFLAVGLLRRDSFSQQTALLAGEAVADAEILTLVMKAVDRRAYPANIPTHGNFADSWFDNKNGFGHGSFPSGHTVAAFSVATVIARRYGNHRWVPYVAYGAAAVVGFSRLTLAAHFPSDVFMGAALGYSITRFVVLRR